MSISENAGQYLNRLGETDIQILNYIRKNKEACSRCTIEALAAKCNVSRTTILRFTQKLGFSGFSEMKVRLKLECEQGKKLPDNVLELICGDYRKLTEDMKERDCEDICRTLHGADKVFAYGTGAVQTNVARELQRAFLSARRYIYLLEGTHHETGLVSDTIGENDAGIIISMTGETETGVEFAKALKLRGVKLISITKFKNNTLARLSDHSLYINTSNVDSMFSQGYETTAHFFIAVEMLLLKYLRYLQSHM
ncbi:MAG: MurR/RpiR family transcriptional regulator [Clostridiales Family XIII bacterium]|nr:MurR/RpiR family transcriptional regulator [Clostridiales Family XIII bacterium]